MMLKHKHHTQLLLCILLFTFVLSDQWATEINAQAPSSEFVIVDVIGRGAPQAVAWSNGGTVLAVATERWVQFYDINFRLLGEVDVTKGCSYCGYFPLAIAWSPDDLQLVVASGEFDGYSVLIDAVNYRLVESFQGSGGNNIGSVDGFNISWHPTEPLLAIPSLVSVKLWDTTSAETIDIPSFEVPYLQVHASGVTDPFVNAALWSPDGSKLATLDMAAELVIWDAATLTEVNSTVIPSAPPNRVYTMDWNDDGTQMAVAVNGDVAIYDISTMTLIKTLPALSDYEEIRSVSWHGDQIITHALRFGPELSYADSDVMVNVWTVSQTTALTLTPPSHPHNTYRTTVAWNLTAGRVALAAQDHIYLWDTQTGQLLNNLRQFSAPVRELAWLDDTTLVATNGGGVPQIWDLSAGEVVSSFPRLAESHYTIATNTATGEVALLYNSSEQGVTLIDPATESVTRVLANSIGGAVVDWYEDAERPLLAIGIPSLSVAKVWNTATGDLISEIPLPDNPRGIEWHSDGIHLAILVGSRDLIIWNVDTDQEQVAFALNDTEFAYALEWRPSGNVLAIGTSSGKLLFWDLQTQQFIANYDLDPLTITDIAWRNSEQLAIAQSNQGLNGQVVVFEYATGTTLASLPTGSNGTDIAWSPNGLNLAVAGQEGSITIWSQLAPPQAPSNLQWDGVAVGADNAVGFTFQDDGSTDPDYRQEDGFELEWRGGYQGTFTDWMPYATLPPHAGNGNTVAFSITPPIACQYDQIGVRVRAFYDTQPRLYSDWTHFTDVSLATC